MGSIAIQTYHQLRKQRRRGGRRKKKRELGPGTKRIESHHFKGAHPALLLGKVGRGVFKMLTLKKYKD